MTVAAKTGIVSGTAPAAKTASADSRAPFPSSRSSLFLLLTFVTVWYAFWLFLPKARPIPLNLTFNSMLTHLMHGQFYVDPQIVGDEGYLHGGHVYAYWGIWCALLRLPLWIIGRMDIDITALSCLAALLIAVAAKLRLLFRLQSLVPQNPVTRSACQLMFVYILLGGTDAGYLRANVFQEAIQWAYAFAAVFLYFAIKGLIQRSFGVGTLSAMALCTGLSIATRISVGVALTMALGFLMLVLIAQSCKPSSTWTFSFPSCCKALASRRFLVPLGILAVCIAATGWVNYMRWGNPLTFADFRLYVGNRLWPDRIPRDAAYGMFNLKRLPLGLVYYFFPVWALHTGSGHLLFGQAQVRLFDLIELPPATFFLTDLLAICFIVFLFVALARRRSGLPPLPQCAAIAAGLLAPCVLMLCFVDLTYRYRMDFYPEIDFLSFLGLFVVLSNPAIQAKFAAVQNWMKAALIVSAVATFCSLIWYVRSPFGPAQYRLQPGIVPSAALVSTEIPGRERSTK